MQLLKIGDVLINPEQIASIDLRADARDCDKVIGHAPNPALSHKGEPMPVYAKLDAVRITMADGSLHVFADAEAEAVRNWCGGISGVHQRGYDLIDLTSKSGAGATFPKGSLWADISWTASENGKTETRVVYGGKDAAETIVGKTPHGETISVKSWAADVTSTPDARTGGTEAPKESADEAKPVNFREFT